MSAYGIAAELNRRKVSAMNGLPWDAASVISAKDLMKILDPARQTVADRAGRVVIWPASAFGHPKKDAGSQLLRWPADPRQATGDHQHL
jgi:hypothetical protein